MADASETGSQHMGILWMFNLDASPLVSVAPRVATTFQQAGPEAASSLAQAMGLDDPTPVLQRFASGRHCYVGRVEDRLATYGWITFDEEGIGELGLNIRLQASEAYIWDCATLPAYRGQRLYPALLAYMLSELQSEGLHRIWIGTDADNLPSQSGVALVGCQPVVDVVMTRVLTLRRPWVRGRPGVPEQVVTDARSALLGNRAQAWLAAPPLSRHEQAGEGL
jgi:GNAT superfamily N-acetyltransferase